MSKTSKKHMVQPIWYAVASIFTAPLIAILLVMLAALMIIALPVIPFLCYLQRKEELQDDFPNTYKIEVESDE